MLGLLSAPSPNTASRWFAAAEELGDFMGILYGRVLGDSDEVEWQHVSHLESDGIGAFARLLKQHGMQVERLPLAGVPSRGVLGPLLRYWCARRSSPPCAGRSDWAGPVPAANQEPSDRAWHLFGEDDTAAILGACRRENVSANSFLLHHLDRAVRPELGLDEARIPWMVPVNLRDERTATSTANHVSCVDAIIAPDDSAQSIHRQLREQLERGEHRAGALLMALGRFMTQSQRRRVLAKGRAKNAGNIGAFSNLGSWDAEGCLPTKDSWLLCPPVAGGQRLAAGCITFQGRLGLAIRTHKDETRHDSLAGEWMMRWVGGIMGHAATL